MATEGSKGTEIWTTDVTDNTDGVGVMALQRGAVLEFGI